MPKPNDSQLIVLEGSGPGRRGCGDSAGDGQGTGREGRIEPRSLQTHAGDPVEARNADLA